MSGSTARQIRTVRNRGWAGELWLGRLGIQAKHDATLVVGLSYWIFGSVDWHIVGTLLLGSLPGIDFGSHLATHIADRFMIPTLASILMLMGMRLIVSKVRIRIT